MFLRPNIIGTKRAPDLFGAGRPLDASRSYLIVPNAIGHGRSTKPSEGLRAKFAHYGYPDPMDALMPIASQPVPIAGRNLKDEKAPRWAYTGSQSLSLRVSCWPSGPVATSWTGQALPLAVAHRA